MASLPTSVRGAVTDHYGSGNTDLYSGLMFDALEQVPELQPGYQSILAYAQMAKDPTLAAVLSSYQLQIRRASWAIDGTGCRPEVTQQVADDLGLPIVGADRPTAARIRGVSWWEHLRAVLQMLVYGHYGFELQAEVVDGKARLVGLWDRAPWTVDLIHADPKTGELLGISQESARTNGKPQITADRLAWYAHERVGANWAGTSLLRPGYGVHIFKREVLRHTAIAHRRFSMGVPVVEWAQGMTQLSPEQITAAQKVASAARVGETAGASLPPGATLKLVGLSGGVPDNIAFLKWLDTQLSRFALMPHIELGQNTGGGSRALGTAFIDSWTLSLGSIGSTIADQATRQICARIVEWNWGLDEPVPAIRVNGIGEQREVTAEALQLLMSSGALDADPALKAWIRREWRLPEVDPDFEPATTATKGAPGQPGEDDPPPADDKPVTDGAEPEGDWGLFGTAKVKASQPTLFDDVLAASGGDVAERLQAEWEDAKARLLKRWPKLAAPMVTELAKQAEAAVRAGDLSALGQLQASAGVLAALAAPLAESGSKLAQRAAEGVVAEAAAVEVRITAPERAGAETVLQHADVVSRLIAGAYASGAAKTGLQLAGADPREVRNAVAEHLKELGQAERGLVGENVGALLSAAQFAGRLAVLEAHPAKQYVAVESLDKSVCQPCAETANKTYKTLRLALVDYPGSGRMRRCEGRARCRGHIRPLW